MQPTDQPTFSFTPAPVNTVTFSAQETGITLLGPVQGPKGDVGPAGAKGDTGLQGIQGVKGDTGDAGPAGATGPKGDTGATGPAGADGTNGSNGAAATIAVGTVTTGAAGSSAVITNAGTSSAAVFNFTIPKGDTGVSGSGSGDTSSNTTTSVDGEIALFSGTGGKTIKRATGSGIPKLASGVLGTAAAGTDYLSPAGTEVVTNKDLTAVSNTFPTLNQNTTGSAAKWTTPRNLAGNSVDGSANVAFANKFIVQGTADSGLSSAQFLGVLSTGILKVTGTTGVLSTAVAADFPTLNQNTTGTAANITGTLAVSQGGTGATATTGTGNNVLASSPTLTTPTIADFTNAGHNHTNAAGGGTLTYAALPAGACVQVVSSNSTAVVTGTTLIPQDDTIPQITEGTEFLTVTITPKTTTNKLVIEAIIYAASTTAGNFRAIALFQDSTANALAAADSYADAANAIDGIVLRYVMAAGTTSATTFRIRGGNRDASTFTMNGTGVSPGTRRFGGVLNSTLIVREYNA